MRKQTFTIRHLWPLILSLVLTITAYDTIDASVVYSSFLKGEKTLVGNTLSWSTSSEQDCDFFLLEKSMDGLFFERVAILKAGGNSSVERKYFYTDSSENSLRVFYRILQVDADGGGTYSHAVILSDKAADSPFRMEYVESSITSKHLVFSLNAQEAGTLSYRILTQLGKLKSKGDQKIVAGSNSVRIDLDGIEVGTYQLAIKVKNDIEVFALRKTDDQVIPTANLSKGPKD
ncbi:MAG: hypothetical protein AAF985_18565 [Bacteroidota bacterium]